MTKIRKKYLHVCLSPTAIEQYDASDSIVVVIDVLRATTAMMVAFGHGAASITPVDDVQKCLAYREKGYLIAGERKAERIEGFDFGNSPYDFMTPRIQGAKIAMTTTNGTKAIRMAVAQGAKEVLVGAFSNTSILCEWLRAQNENICLLCSGWNDHPNMEDTIFAGALARQLKGDFHYYQDTAFMADVLYLNAIVRKKYFIENSSHHRRLIHLNLQKDVKFAMKWDTYPALPVLFGDELIDISKMKGDFAEIKQQILMQKAESVLHS